MVAFADQQQVTGPPRNEMAERSLLGGILLSPQAFDEVADIVSPEHFYRHSHSLIFRAIKLMVDRGSYQIDAVTLAEELDRQKSLEDCGGIEYLMQILETVPHAAHAKGYAEIVRDQWLKRRLTDGCTDILRKCYEGNSETTDVLAEAEQSIFSILEERERHSQSDMRSILMETLNRLDTRGKDQSHGGLSTGFVDLDHQTNGLRPSELIILAARPSMGKTAFVCNLAATSAEQGSSVLIFSLEQSKLELAERFLCISSKVDGHRLRKGDIDNQQRKQLADTASLLAKWPLFIDDQAGRTVGQIAAIARRMKRKHKLGLLIIDYLQLIEPEDKRAPREQQIAQITRRLKGIAKDLGIPVIALSQLNRGLETRDNKRPRLADLRESGAIEQDADIVMFLHRPEVFDPTDQPGLAEVIVAKHRSGPTGTVKLTWRKECMRFENYAAIPDEPQFDM